MAALPLGSELSAVAELAAQVTVLALCLALELAAKRSAAPGGELA
jgi:hypothetical protein